MTSKANSERILLKFAGDVKVGGTIRKYQDIRQKE